MTARKEIIIGAALVLLFTWWLNSNTKPLQLIPQSDSGASPNREWRTANKGAIKKLLDQKDIPLEEIETFGYDAIPFLTELYAEADNNLDKSRIAWVFWRLGWKSTEIEQALLPDLDTSDANFKVWVQWGIAKSTQSDEVINKLLFNLENDPSPFVRDKAACALASDFIHISPTQRITILRGLVDGLSNETQQIRGSSIQALLVQTGQTKNYVATADVSSRAQAIDVWEEWVDEYERNL